MRLAESERARSMVEALAASEIALSGASPARRAAVTAALQRVEEFEAALRDIRAQDPEAIADDMRNRLADFVGGDPGILGIRVTNPGTCKLDSEALLRVTDQLRAARATLRGVLAEARAESPTVLPERLQSEDLSAIAAKAGFPIVYALATVYGGAALFVPPQGPIEHLLLDITSDVTSALLHGDGRGPAYIDGALGDDDEVLAEVLPHVLETLAGSVAKPIAEWLTVRGHRRAALIPLGRLGLLPVHAAAPEAEPALGYAPSARGLSRALDLASRPRAGNAERVFLGIGNPTQSIADTLPFAVAEVRSAARLPERWSRTAVLVAREATRDQVLEHTPLATHIHFACHGSFRPSDPNASSLVLAGGEITLGAILRGEADLSVAEIVVLSACQTASTEFRILPDEVRGLPSGLLLAGVPRVVGTMWRVDDLAAAFFCERFYEELFVAGREPAEAVAAAQRWLRDATADDLAQRALALRAALAESDHESAAALAEAWRELVASKPTHRPFSGPADWAAFTYSGI